MTQPTPAPPTGYSASLAEVIAELDPLGLAKWEAAQARALTKKLAARVTELEQQLAGQPADDAEQEATPA